jgi:hypothetical protein
MLIVLIFEAIIKGEKLKIGGKLSRMVKDNKEELTQILGRDESLSPENKIKALPKYGYLRLNALRKKANDDEDENSEEEEIDVLRKQLKKDGYKVKRISNLNIL